MRPLSRFGDPEPDLKARPIREVDQGIEAELLDTAAQQIVQARLRDLQPARRLGLRHLPAGDALPQRDQQVRPHGHAGRHRGRIFQRVPDIGEALALQLGFHVLSYIIFDIIGKMSVECIDPAPSASSGHLPI